MVARVESDPDKDTIQQIIHSIHKDEILVRIQGSPPIYISVAQLAEQRPPKPKVEGSTPSRDAKYVSLV